MDHLYGYHVLEKLSSNWGMTRTITTVMRLLTTVRVKDSVISPARSAWGYARHRLRRYSAARKTTFHKVNSRKYRPFFAPFPAVYSL